MKSQRLSWNSIAIIFLLGTQIGYSQNEIRTWTGKNKKHTVEASFESYDTDSKTVTLSLESGETISVNLRLLSRKDQRFVHNARKSVTLPAENVEKKAKKNKRPATQKRNSQTKFGIDWTTDLERALAAAEGEEGPQDDRPIMWFRVLGQLDGDM